MVLLDFTFHMILGKGVHYPLIYFFLVSQIFTSYISNRCLHGISIADKQIFISQLADDTTLFLQDANQVPLALKYIQQFSKASGLFLNLSKCELMSSKM